MSLEHADFAMLDEDLEAILRVPITRAAFSRRRRRRGLFLALPISIIIGVITLGSFKNEGWLSANDVPTSSLISSRAVPPVQRESDVPGRSVSGAPNLHGFRAAAVGITPPYRSMRTSVALPATGLHAASSNRLETRRAEPTSRVALAAVSATPEMHFEEQTHDIARLDPMLDPQSRVAANDALRELRLK